MSNNEKVEGDILPPFHLTEAYPDASSIFAVSLPSLEQSRDEALIVLDTNVLLIPYTINPKSLDDIKRTYIRLINEGRLFIPAQVAREFAKNRANKIGELFQQLSRKRNKLDSLQVGRYPLLEPLTEYKELLEFEKDIDEKVKQYRRAIGDILNHIRSWRWNDSVSLLYRELFQPSVIVDTPMTNSEIEGDLKRRNVNRIPPGFKDSSKPDQGVGDLVIWHTILHLGRERKKTVIFVSGEEKTDWWHRSEGEPLYPRFELVDEFMRISDNKAFHIAKFSQLLDIFGAEEQVVAEVRKEEVVRRAVPSHGDFMGFIRLAEQAVYSWLQNRFPSDQIIKKLRFPEFVVELTNNKRIGIEVKAFRNSPPSMLAHRIRDFAYRGYYEINEGDLDGFILVLVIQDEAVARQAVAPVERAVERIPQIDLVVGTLDSAGAFVSIAERLSVIYE